MTYAGRHVRPWGGGWDIVAEQQPLPNGGNWGPALILLNVSECPGEGPGAELNLNSGEARTLAAQLLPMADRLDLR